MEINKMASLQENANELQNKANELQQKMIKVIKRNNDVTSTHNTIMRWLTGAIVVLAIITLWTNYNKTGRYAISGGKGGVYVLDTKTSQLWQRASNTRKNLYFGTNENPEGILIESKDKPNQ